MALYDSGPARRHVRDRHRVRAARHPGEPEVRVPRRARSGEPAARARSIASATSSWRRGCRSSSGAAFPTTSCCELASQGRLKDPAVLEQQVRRMLADPKSQALVDNFAGQWLHLRNLQSTAPDQNEFPDFDDNLRQAFQRETELFFDSIIREDRSVLDLLTADYTFVNERLARHYGIPNVYGSQFRRVTVTDDARRGCSARAASCSSRRTPTARRRWCAASGFSRTCSARRRRRRRRTCRRSKTRTARRRPQIDARAAGGAPRQPGVRELPQADGSARVRARELRRRRRVADRTTAARRSTPRGSWPTARRSTASSTLRQALLKRPEVFVGTLTEKLLTYALGRGLEPPRHAGRARDRPRRPRPATTGFRRSSWGSSAARRSRCGAKAQ